MGRPKHALKVPCLFSFQVWWGGGGGGGECFFFLFFPWFPMCLHYVLFKFSICSPSSQFIPQHVLHSTSLLFSFHLYRWAKGEELLLQNRTFYFGEPSKFHFFWVMGQSNWLVARGKTKEKKEAPHLINRRGE